MNAANNNNITSNESLEDKINLLLENRKITSKSETEKN